MNFNSISLKIYFIPGTLELDILPVHKANNQELVRSLKNGSKKSNMTQTWIEPERIKKGIPGHFWLICLVCSFCYD